MNVLDMRNRGATTVDGLDRELAVALRRNTSHNMAPPREEPSLAAPPRWSLGDPALVSQAEPVAGGFALPPQDAHLPWGSEVSIRHTARDPSELAGPNSPGR